ncbi:MAG TPA: DUF3618 domain-containing protein [Pyrinomonadaceae bacterium]|nr:DUF3618 domain-containing protein [Pyrinomonadaceae bacterium]
MDQRSDQLEPGWIEERRSGVPRVDEEMIVVEAVEFDELDDEAERIKADIEDTRAELGQTINEIQERLSPEHLMDQVKETVREATIGKVERAMDRVGETISNVTEPAMDAMGRAGEKLKETGSSMTNIVQQNPIACTLIGLGLGMYIVNRIRNADGGRSRLRAYQPEFEAGMAVPRHVSAARQHGEYAGVSRQHGSLKRNLFGRVKDTAGELTHGTAETVSHLGHQAKEGAMRAGRGFQHLIEENPLAAGAAAVAVGAVVGLALPATRMEREYMGEASEKVMDKAQQVARDAMDKVKTAAQGEGSNQPQANQPQANQPQAKQGQPGNQGQTQGQAKQGKPTKQGQQPGLNG